MTILAEKLEIPRAQAIGHLHLLWWWCIDYAVDGILDRYTPPQIASAAGWQGNAGAFIQHLADSKFLDRGPLRVHDWLDFCGDLIKKRLEYKKEKRRRTKRLGVSLRKHENSQPTSRTVPAVPAVPVFIKARFAKPTATEVTAYAASIGFRLDGERFCAHYESNGWRVGKNPMRSWQAAVVTWKKGAPPTAMILKPVYREPDKPMSDDEQKDGLEFAKQLKEALKLGGKEMPQ